MEKTFKLSQQQIAEQVDLATSRKARRCITRSLSHSFLAAVQIFDLNLDTFGPYSISYTRNGRFVALTSSPALTTNQRAAAGRAEGASCVVRLEERAPRLRSGWRRIVTAAHAFRPPFDRMTRLR